MSEQRAGEGLRDMGGHVRVPGCSAPMRLPVRQAPGAPASATQLRSEAAGLPATREEMTISKQYLVAVPLQPGTRQETLVAWAPTEPAPLAHVLALDRR